MSDLQPLFPELADQETLVRALEPHARIEKVGQVGHANLNYPLLTFTLGSRDPQAPVLAIFGGVHGLERIGSQVVLAYMQGLAERMSWDETLHWQLKHCRVCLMPLVNPVGMYLRTRSNGNGVDLMRNSPTVAERGAATFLVGGQRYSRLIPWYMGDAARMEVESQALVDYVQRETSQSKAAILLDVHSGFGVRDQLWFPYAKTQVPFASLAEVFKLKSTLDRIFPNHVYLFEPQAKNYTTHGDLWDYLYDEHYKRGGNRAFIPITLEMGSWMWVKKNPLQLFSYLGAFNPVKPHRRRRILRRHLTLFDYLIRLSVSPAVWSTFEEIERKPLEAQARELWYPPRILPSPN